MCGSINHQVTNLCHLCDRFDAAAATKVLPKANEVTVSMKMAPVTFEDVLRVSVVCMTSVV